MKEAEQSNRFLLCRIESRIGALALKDVRETMRPLPIEPLPGMPPFVLVSPSYEAFRSGRRCCPAVETCRIAVEAGHFAAFSTIRLAQIGERTAVLAVDAVLDIRPLAAEILADIPPLIREAGTEQMTLIGTLDAHLLLVLEAGPSGARAGLECNQCLRGVRVIMNEAAEPLRFRAWIADRLGIHFDDNQARVSG